jgi:hypothetical protein
LLFNLFCGFSPPKKWPPDGRLRALTQTRFQWLDRVGRMAGGSPPQHHGAAIHVMILRERVEPTGDRVLFAL